MQHRQALSALLGAALLGATTMPAAAQFGEPSLSLRRTPAPAGDAAPDAASRRGSRAGGPAGKDSPRRTTPARVDLGDGRVEVPMELVRGLPTIRPTADDRRERVYVVDTGASACVFADAADLAGADRVAAPLGAVGDAGGVRRSGLSGVRVGRLRIGPASFDDFDAVALDLPDLRAVIGDDCGGYLGMPLFAGCTVTLDYPRRTLVVTRDPLPPPVVGGGGDVLPVLFAGDRPTVPVTVGGEPRWALLDTGSDDRLWLSADRVRRGDLSFGPVEGDAKSGVFGRYRTRLGRLAGDLVVAGHVVARPVVQVAPGDDSVVLGSKLLGEFAVSIDVPNRRVRLARPARERGPIYGGGVVAAGASWSAAVGATSAGASASRLTRAVGDADRKVRWRANAEVLVVGADVGRLLRVPDVEAGAEFLIDASGSAELRVLWEGRATVLPLGDPASARRAAPDRAD